MPALEIISQAIVEVEAKADNALAHRKYMMFGYYKAVAVYLRRIARQIKREESESGRSKV